MNERQKLQEAIIAQESLRGTIDDSIIDATVNALRKQLADVEGIHQDERRKQVTVVFADLVGFTALSERLDPEEVRAIQSVYFAAVTPAIEKYDGAVEKYIGDALLAVFGLPQARENDPENAVRAALEMQASLKKLNDQLSSQWGFELAMRIGVNTGMVLATVRGGDDFLVTGDPVNLASRLESAAPPGGVLISHTTYRHIHRLFEVEVLEPILVKGKVDPIQVYLVVAGLARQFRSINRGFAGVKTGLVGRQSEMNYLEQTLLTVEKEKRRQWVTIVGDAGVGKSRLLYEFEDMVEREWFGVKIFRGRASHEARHKPYELMRSLFALHCQIQDSDGVDGLCRKLETGVQGILGEDVESRMKSHYIGYLLGYDLCSSAYLAEVVDDPKQIYNRTRRYLEDFFRRSTALSPTLILLEDIHWADDSSLDLLQHLAVELSDKPLLIICLARPSLYDRYPQWGQGKQGYHRLGLTPLTTKDCLRMIQSILINTEHFPQKLLDLILRYADGNPFYVEEFINMMIEEGVIQVGADSWVVDTSHMSTLRVPPTLTGVLQSRLERLPQLEQNVLQGASVVGRTFWDQVIQQITGLMSERMKNASIYQAIDSLQGREMIFQSKPSTIAGAEEYIFKHALLREVTYESVLKITRKRYHGLIADWLIAQLGDRSGEISGLIGEHLELSDRKREAIEYFSQAAHQAFSRYANQAAITYFQRAIDLVEGLPDKVGRKVKLASLYEAMGDAYGLLHQKSEARETFQRALSVVAGEELIWRARLERKIGNYSDGYLTRKNAYDLAEKALGEEPGGSDATWWQEWIEIYTERIWICYLFGQVDDFDELCDRTKPIIDAYGTAAQQVRFLGALGAHDNRRNRFVVTEEAVSYSRQALDWAHQTGNLREIASHQFSLGFYLLWAGQLQEAETTLASALELGDKIGDTWIQTASLNYLAVIYRLCGQPEQVNEYAGLALQKAKEAELDSYKGMAIANLGWLAWFDGNKNLAEANCTESLNILTSTTNPFNWCVLFPLIQIAQAKGEVAKVVDFLSRLLDPLQMRLPDELSEVAEKIITAWESGQETDASTLIDHMLVLAKEYGYL